LLTISKNFAKARQIAVQVLAG